MGIFYYGGDFVNAKNWKTYGVWILLSLGVGGLSAMISRTGMAEFQQWVLQPALSPPTWLFPVVWSILYILMGVGAARIWLSPSSELRSMGIRLFLSQLGVNFLWSPIFFQLQLYPLAFLWLLLLWGLVVWMISVFRKVDPLAGNLQLPYLLWLTFAAYLSAGVWYLNG